jgi:hypothetical protein
MFLHYTLPDYGSFRFCRPATCRDDCSVKENAQKQERRVIRQIYLRIKYICNKFRYFYATFVNVTGLYADMYLCFPFDLLTSTAAPNQTLFGLSTQEECDGQCMWHAQET